jgi:hypothetical protein
MLSPSRHFLSFRQLPCCIIQRITIPKFCLPKICNHISLYGITVRGAIIYPTSQAPSSPILLLASAENLKVLSYGRPQWHNTHIKFHPNPSSGSRVESCGQTDTASPICVHFMHIMQRTHHKHCWLVIICCS